MKTTTQLQKALISALIGAMMCLGLAIAKQVAAYVDSPTSATAQVETEEYLRMHREVTGRH